MSKFIYNLNEIDYKDISLVGGKAASLGEMIKAGISVPPGFVITTEAYSNGMTDDLIIEIKEAFSKLGADRVAVRSSAIAEDNKAASWAGQLESYLNSTKKSLVNDIIKCWGSINSARAKDYANKNKIEENQKLVAVIVQVMVDSELSGVMFTANPITGSQEEYVIETGLGLCELLVRGEIIPEFLRVNKFTKEVLERVQSGQQKKLVYKNGKNIEVKLTQEDMSKELVDETLLNQLIILAINIEKRYKGAPQDIEWAVNNNKLYAVQSRPITTMDVIMNNNEGNKETELPIWRSVDLFYWGPTRALPLYMSDFMSAVEEFFVQLSVNSKMPAPPDTLALFNENKMVWLNNSEEFSLFVGSLFKIYEKRNKLDEDLKNWRNSVKKHDLNKSDAKDLVEVWSYTLLPEFSLYGARDVITERLMRFDEKTRQKIWGTFTLPENSSFMTRIDDELLRTEDPVKLAFKYPWIEDGYSGTSDNAKNYFSERLTFLKENPLRQPSIKFNKQSLIKKLGLTNNELQELNLARQLAEFLDERKEWMMRSRSYIKNSANNIEFGWLFKNGKSTLINKKDTSILWDRYINFKTLNTSLKGMVACSGNAHYITGEVRVLNTPTDSVGNNQILVVPSTSPSYVPLMRKAKAVITDHGGMMSHAAIVARELNIPCIVGTKQATKILKTGDKVVLDLIKGDINK